MPIRSRISSIMGQIELEHPSYLPLNLEKLLNMTLFTLLSSTNINQSAPNLVKMYVTIRSQMTSIMDLIGPEMPELSALEIRKFAIFNITYTLASANFDQSVPNLATIYMPIRSRMSSIMGQIGEKHRSNLPLSSKKLLNLTLFTL